MCGINGILYFNSFCSGVNDSFFEANIKKMNRVLAHRGPDGDNLFIHYPVCLGHTRLSIIDLSEEAGQPMFNEDKSVVIVFNGEIYNYLELIPELKCKGHIFKTKSDTEVIIHSYEEYGFECVNKFNGMWSFVIYDIGRKILFASRDRFGVKPFYYYTDKNNFIFSSEIKAILEIKKIQEANPGKVYDYLAYGYKTSNGDTFFNDIHELLPAHNIIIEKNKIKVTRYWDFNNEQDNLESTEIFSSLDYLVRDAVKIRFRSDVPVSLLLSGGMDSSIIAKVADELIENGELKNKCIAAYSATFPGFKYDESSLIKDFVRTCKHIKSYQITFNNEPLFDKFDDFVYGMGEPVFGTTGFVHYLLMKEMKNLGVKVALNGQGADEAWSGYDRYIMGYLLLDILFSRPQELITNISGIRNNLKFSYVFILIQTIKALLSRRYGSFLRSKYNEGIYNVLSEDFVNQNYLYFENPDYKKFSSNNLKSYLKYNIQYQGFNQILHYEDHSSMQSSIEIRSPFIDYRLMELAFSIPAKKHVDSGMTKKILREIYKESLPDSIINNFQKIGFDTPYDNWFYKDASRYFMNSLLQSHSFKSKKIWDAGKISEIYGKKIHKQFPFWRIVNLEQWSRVYGINNL